MGLPPLHWNFCLNCNGTLSEQEIADDDSFCRDCMEMMND